MERPHGVHILLTTPTDAVYIDRYTDIERNRSHMRHFGLAAFLALTLLLIGFIAHAVPGPGRHMGPGWHMGPRSRGPGGRHRGDWDHGTVPEPFRPMLERWHRDAHAATTGSAPSADAATSPAGPRPPAMPPTSPTGQPSA